MTAERRPGASDGALHLMLRRLHHEQPRAFRLHAGEPGVGEGAGREVSRGAAGERGHSAALAGAGAGGVGHAGRRSRRSRGCWAWPISGCWRSRPSTSCSSCNPTGSVAHVQVCGTTSCMICGAEELIAVCRRKIAPHAARGVGGRQVLLGGGRVPRGLRQCADGADRQGLLRGPDGGGVRGDPRRLRARRGAAAGAAERALRLGAAGRADDAGRRRGRWRRTPR